MKNILFLVAMYLFVGCSPSITTNLASKKHEKLSSESQMVVLEKNDKIPENSEYIGEVKIGDTGFTTDCGYNKVLSDATTAARNAGANILHITEVKKPTVFGSTCYRIRAKIYRNLNPDLLLGMSEKRNLKNKSRIPEGSDYALVHFYRPTSGNGALLGYKIKDANDSIIGRLRNGEKFVYKVKKFGNQSFYGALETKEEVKINVEKGQEYFVRCSVNMGVIVGRPEINLIENHIGMKEFDEMH